jgi:hypothetical protein
VCPPEEKVNYNVKKKLENHPYRVLNCSGKEDYVLHHPNKPARHRSDGVSGSDRCRIAGAEEDVSLF